MLIFVRKTTSNKLSPTFYVVTSIFTQNNLITSSSPAVCKFPDKRYLKATQTLKGAKHLLQYGLRTYLLLTFLQLWHGIIPFVSLNLSEIIANRTCDDFGFVIFLGKQSVSRAAPRVDTNNRPPFFRLIHRVVHGQPLEVGILEDHDRTIRPGIIQSNAKVRGGGFSRS